MLSHREHWPEGYTTNPKGSLGATLLTTGFWFLTLSSLLCMCVGLTVCMSHVASLSPTKQWRRVRSTRPSWTGKTARRLAVLPEPELDGSAHILCSGLVVRKLRKASQYVIARWKYDLMAHISTKRIHWLSVASPLNRIKWMNDCFPYAIVYTHGVIIRSSTFKGYLLMGTGYICLSKV